MQETLQSGSAQAQVRLGTGPPTFDELRVFYQPKFTWSQLKLFVNSGYVCAPQRAKQAVDSSHKRSWPSEARSYVTEALQHMECRYKGRIWFNRLAISR